MNKFITITLSILFCTSVAYSQEWVEKMNDHSVNFYEVQKSFEKYFNDKSYEKGQGRKQYRRWENFMEPRVYPTGNRFDPKLAWQETMGFRKKEKKHRLTNKNANWQPLGPIEWQSYSYNPGLGRINCITVHPTNSNIIFVGTPAGGAWKSNDGGQSWIPISDNLPVLGVSDIVFNPQNHNVIYMATGDKDGSDTYSIGMLKSTDGGNSWNTTSFTTFINQQFLIREILINPLDTNIIWVASSNGIWQTRDNGGSWANIQNGSFRKILMKPGDTSVVYASSDQFYRSTDGGNSFNHVSSNISPASSINRMEIAVTPADPNVVYAVAGKQSDATFEGLYKSTNQGQTFTLQKSSPNIFGYQANGSDNSGQSSYDLALAVSTTNANELYIGGINVWGSTNGGLSLNIKSHWVYPSSIGYTHADIHTLEYINGKIYCGSDGGIFESANAGNSWNDLSQGLQISQFYRMAQTEQDANVLLAGAQDNGCNYRTDSSEWYHVLGADGMDVAIDPTNYDIMYFESQNGNIRISVNGGISSSGISSTMRSAENAAWVTPFMLNPKNNRTLYAGYENLWKSLDYGNNWTTISNFGTSTTLRTIAVAPSDTNVIYVCGNNRSIQYTNDGGQNWSLRRSGLPSLAVTDIEIHPSFADSAWATISGTTSNRKVYVTGNGGQNWTNISTNLPNLPVNTIAIDTVTGITYVGTDVGVYYRDESTSVFWQSYMTGLPNVIVNELEIHYATGMLRAATFGRGIWESTLLRNSTSVNPIKVEKSDLSVSPNPTKGVIRIENTEEFNEITVFNVNAKLVKEMIINSTNSTTIDLSDLNEGVYILHIKSKNGVSEQKVVKL